MVRTHVTNYYTIMCNQLVKFVNRLPLYSSKRPWVKFILQKLGMIFFIHPCSNHIKKNFFYYGNKFSK